MRHVTDHGSLRNPDDDRDSNPDPVDPTLSCSTKLLPEPVPQPNPTLPSLRNPAPIPGPRRASTGLTLCFEWSHVMLRVVSRCSLLLARSLSRLPLSLISCTRLHTAMVVVCPNEPNDPSPSNSHLVRCIEWSSRVEDNILLRSVCYCYHQHFDKRVEQAVV